MLYSVYKDCYGLKFEGQGREIFKKSWKYVSGKLKIDKIPQQNKKGDAFKSFKMFFSKKLFLDYVQCNV